MTFREPSNYFVLFLTLSAAAIGWRRNPRLLWPLLLSIASVLAFRSLKETWFLSSLQRFQLGGYLICRLPQLTIAIDGRTNVHGDERVGHFGDMWMGKPGWASDPELLNANVVVAKKDTALGSLLRLDVRFKIVYEDAQAVVFQRR